MSWISSWLRRRKRPSLDQPPAPNPAGIVEAQAQLRRAEDTLTRLVAREPEVDHASQTAAEIHRRNNLGPAFMAALGQHRKA